MRVTNSMIYGSVIRNTNDKLAEYYKLSEKNSSQKDVNRPSDDPTGTDSILRLRSELDAMDQYESNITTGTNWLGAADSSLNSMSELIISSKELAEQAATGTLSQDQREMVADQLRENMDQMIAEANTEVNGESIFAGQATDMDTYAQGLGADVTSGVTTEADIVSVTGGADHAIQVEFLDAGEVGSGAGVTDLDYRYSDDGGKTWQTGTLAAGDTTLDLGGAKVELADGAQVSDDTDAAGSTVLVVRPTALYQGDAADGASVGHYGSSAATGTAEGYFPGKVAVRIDSASVLPATTTYSYSTDGGSTWVEGQTAEDGKLTVPGGVLELSPPGTALSEGEQFIIQPEEADISLDISDTGTVTINNVGKDIFGGTYQAPGDAEPQVVEGANLFDTMGELIGAVETGNQDAIAAALDKLTATHEHVLSAAADVGAREERLVSAGNALEHNQFNDEKLLSAIEDADLTTLMVNLESAEVAYTSVVETSSQIMQLSLLNYI